MLFFIGRDSVNRVLYCDESNLFFFCECIHIREAMSEPQVTNVRFCICICILNSYCDIKIKIYPNRLTLGSLVVNRGNYSRAMKWL